MDNRIIFVLVGSFFCITTVFLVFLVNSKTNEYDIFCNISLLDSERDYPISVTWDIHPDRLFGHNVAIYSAQVCDRQHCIGRSTVLTIGDDKGYINETHRALVCPVMGEEKTTLQNWQRIEQLNRKKAIIFKVGAELWPEVANTILIDNLITAGTRLVCISDNTKNTYNLTVSLPKLHAGSVTTQEILLICTSIMMGVSALACVIALCLCLWRKCCRQRQLIFATEAWMNRVTVTWPDNDQSVPALADKMRVPHVEVERFQILVRQGRDDFAAENEAFQLPFDPKWELVAHTSLRFGKILGIGPVGKIVLAEVSNELSEVKMVAVKMLKNSFKPADLKSLISELEIMKMLNHHENLINLIGCCTTKCAPLLFMDYAELGNLQAFLKRDTNVQELTYGRQISFACQIAKGMQFLAENKCVHRNLASRNILLTSDLKVKISNHASYHDLSNTEFLAQMTSRNLMAIRWLAPESLSDHIFDFKSDIWSFGIVLWEIMSYGSTPYPKLGGDREELRKAICSGYQMEQPEYCTDQMYKVMESCWSFHPFNRPTFKNLVEVSNKFLSANEIGLQRLTSSNPPKLSRSSSVYYSEQPPDYDPRDVDNYSSVKAKDWI